MEKITHHGIVLAIKGNTLEIKIIDRSACMQCPAHNHCGFEEQKEKNISISTVESNTYKVGDTVTISMTTSNSFKAIVYGYILPLILLLTAIIFTSCCGYDDFISGISGIIILIPYYFLLFLTRDKIKSLFNFEIEHRD